MTSAHNEAYGVIAASLLDLRFPDGVQAESAQATGDQGADLRAIIDAAGTLRDAESAYRTELQRIRADADSALSALDRYQSTSATVGTPNLQGQGLFCYAVRVDERRAALERLLTHWAFKRSHVTNRVAVAGAHRPPPRPARDARPNREHDKGNGEALS